MTTKANTTPVTLVVRRGALRRFDRLKQATHELPAEVIWDRRGQSRSGIEDKASDPPVANRRKATPSTWDLADFAVAESAPPRKSAVRRKKS